MKPLFKKVTKKERWQLSVLLNNLRLTADTALSKGDEAQDYDLAQLKVPGTQLFNVGNKGYERHEMPQLKGWPLEDSAAAMYVKPTKSGKLDMSDAFLSDLTYDGILTAAYRTNPLSIRATQSQLSGLKVARCVNELENDASHKKFAMSYYISRDRFLLDGHHGWASILAYCMIHKQGLAINVIEVDMGIHKLVKYANAFMNKHGIGCKTV